MGPYGAINNEQFLHISYISHHISILIYIQKYERQNQTDLYICFYENIDIAYFLLTYEHLCKYFAVVVYVTSLITHVCSY